MGKARSKTNEPAGDPDGRVSDEPSRDCSPSLKLVQFRLSSSELTFPPIVIVRMAKYVLLVGLCLVGGVAAMPANNEQLDKATVNDVAINSVNADEQKADGGSSATQQQQAAVPSTVEITGITTGIGGPASEPENSPKPPRVGSMFARFIDDIFQIPITVLQSVARLITNPFTQAKKDATITATVS
ncbi:uncharacterized protein LOC132705125 [Cylas formicarius]|uniref:uncharacterized protein LOC132705125 n=1 Tax=Cylas formicarius TaxID=197179 RepID=UPI0029587186|nr:uncharacterized protein LOC132705125 [Cylas formicarius]